MRYLIFKAFWDLSDHNFKYLVEYTESAALELYSVQLN